VDQTRLTEHLASEAWQTRFTSNAVAEGKRRVASRLVQDVRAELLDTGDAEITGVVSEKEGLAFAASVALWEEDATLAIDASCSCDIGAGCLHAAALLWYLAKAPAERVVTALGGTSEKNLEKMTGGRTLELDEIPQPKVASTPDAPSFLLRVENIRPPDDEDPARYAWLPAIGAHAFAVYGEHRLPLEPSGNLAPIVEPDGSKKQRDRAAEMNALTALYACSTRTRRPARWHAMERRPEGVARSGLLLATLPP